MVSSETVYKTKKCLVKSGKDRIRDIPIYVRPGDTLDVTVYPHVPGTFPGLKYESNHP